ncbi:MAG: septum formation initiator family protein [Patescibacteria group bacterium]|nr:septum formation initiator family protein [Patescibacteria group bacterium]
MKLKHILVLLVLFAFVLSFLNIAGKISEGQKRLKEIQNKVNAEIKQKQALEQEVKQRQGLSYLEKEARDELNYVMPGERIVILPSQYNSSLSGDNFGNNQTPTVPQTPNWQKWWRLFFE